MVQNDSQYHDSTITTGIISVHKLPKHCIYSSESNVTHQECLNESGKGQGQKHHYTGDHYMGMCPLACPHLFLTVRPLAPEANSVFWSILLSTPLLSAGVTQARDSESESNYTDNYDCDPVRPGFVFKWTHLPWALQMHLLRTECEPRDSTVTLPLCLYYSTHTHTHKRTGTYTQYIIITEVHDYLSAECVMVAFFH